MNAVLIFIVIVAIGGALVYLNNKKKVDRHVKAAEDAIHAAKDAYVKPAVQKDGIKKHPEV